MAKAKAAKVRKTAAPARIAAFKNGVSAEARAAEISGHSERAASQP